jgi:predicted permease
MITLLAASAPAASTVTQFAQIYDHQPFEASVINVLSLLLCIITMPLLNMFYMSLT